MYHLVENTNYRRGLYTMYHESGGELFICNYSFSLKDSYLDKRYEFITNEDYTNFRDAIITRNEIPVYSADTTEQMDEYINKLLIQYELEK